MELEEFKCFLPDRFSTLTEKDLAKLIGYNMTVKQPPPVPFGAYSITFTEPNTKRERNEDSEDEEDEADLSKYPYGQKRMKIVL